MNPHDKETASAWPKPSTDYLSKQRELRDVGAGPQNATKRNRLYSELEQQFTKAWGFVPDVRKQAQKLRGVLCDKVEGFDHCTYYYDARAAMPVIVTQPHYDPTEQLEAGLRLGNWLRPKIIPAHEWSFYHPASGYLVVVKFPHGYGSAVRALRGH